MQKYLLILALGTAQLSWSADTRKLTCNERMRHGPRGLAKAVASLAGLTAVAYFGSELKKVSLALLAPAHRISDETRTDAFHRTVSTVIAMGSLGAIACMLGLSSIESIKLFYADDVEPDIVEKPSVTTVEPCPAKNP